MVPAGNPHLHPSVLTSFVRSILGIVIVLFFKSLAALFDPVHRRGGPVKWGLVTYTVVMFLLVTIGTALQLDTHSISYINNRGFPGVEGVLSPGPLGYQQFINPEAIAIIQNVVSNLNNWLADGFLVCSSLMPGPIIQESNAGSSSSIVAMSSTP